MLPSVCGVKIILKENEVLSLLVCCFTSSELFISLYLPWCRFESKNSHIKDVMGQQKLIIYVCLSSHVKSVSYLEFLFLVIKYKYGSVFNEVDNIFPLFSTFDNDFLKPNFQRHLLVRMYCRSKLQFCPKWYFFLKAPILYFCRTCR